MTARIILGAFAIVISATAAGAPTSSTRAASVTLAELKTEATTNPVGIDVARPRFSWQLRSTDRGVVQRAYEVQVATDSASLARGRALVWDSGRGSSDASVHVEYGGPPPHSATRYWWRVRVWDGAGNESSWSAPAYWETALLSPTDWRARWIEPELPEVDSMSNPSPLVRRAFTLRRPVVSARLYITSHGLYQASINGTPVSDAVFTPGWTSYNKRLQYQTYEVTPLVRRGDNAIGVMLGDGWYRGRIGFSRQRNVYGHKLGLLAQLHVVYGDGTDETITTDSAWRASTGAVRASDIYDGETYDARLEQPGWNAPGFNDSGWRGVRVAGVPTDDKEHLVAPVSPPVRRIDEITPVAILHTPAGQTVFDMGQNMVGWVRLRVRGPAGTTVMLHHAEVLDKAGNLYVANLRAAAETDRYTLKGSGEEVFEPHFTFHGFRYVAVDGYPGEPTKQSVTGIVLHSDMERTGSFETSNPLLNQLQHNIQWGQKGNFVDVPTDCPQRDERLGWTGDAQVFSRTAAFNMDVEGFFTKWLRDLAADQTPAGSVPHVIPNVLGGDSLHNAGSAGWTDAATVIPWNMYVAYGDKRLLAEQYASMRALVEFERRRAGPSYIWNRDSHFGDWLAFATTRADYPGATTSKDLIATAYFAHSADLVARAAAVLGREDDARSYRDLFSKIRHAFDREFVTSTGRVGESTQTAYVLALAFDLLPDSLRAHAANRLAADVRAHGNHLTTGFLGTPDLNHVLSRTGHTDVAYALLLQETYPSWLYPVTHGATTIWERWDGLKPDGSFQDPSMNSFNHYAYGAIGDWMYRVVAGLDVDPEHPGYKHIIIAPQPGGKLSYAAASLHTLYGLASSSWDIRDGRISVHVVVPPNATATVRLPNATLAQVHEGQAALSDAQGVRSPRQDGATVVGDIGSGAYEFSYPYASAASQHDYVFSYFKGNGEDGLHLAHSTDGMRWQALHGDSTFVVPTAGKDKLMRDPSIVRGPGGVFHMVWTASWHERGIGYAESTDLVHWSAQRYLPVMEHEPTTVNAWAPELYYDDATGEYLIFWASTIPKRFPATDHQGAGARNTRDPGWDHRIYYVTTKDFQTFTPTTLLYEHGFNVIDAAIFRSNGRYVLVMKDETDAPFPPQKNLHLAFADHAAGPYSAPTPAITGSYWAEGPTPLRVGDRWIIYFDRYREHRYGAVASRDLEHWTDVSDSLTMPSGMRHGTAFEVGGDISNALVQPAPIPVLETGGEHPMPLEWIDRDTHHRVVRLSRRGGSNESFYFHNNPFFRDTAGNGDKMVFYGTTSNGRQVFSVNLRTLAIDQVTNRDGGARGEIIAPKHREVIWQRGDSVFATHVDRHSTRLIATLPPELHATVSTLNADETLLAGAVAGPQVREILAKYPQKSGYFDRIFEAHAPYALFTVDLRTGEFKKIHEENTWLNHVQFSPTDPSLLMYCHEGPWHLVDRIWTIDVREGAAGEPRKMHTRTVDREIAGHEFFSPDGRTIWYDLQVPRSVSFFLAGVDVTKGTAGTQTHYALTRDEWSIHFTSSPDGALFAGDGGDSTQVARAKDGQWVYLFRPRGDHLESERLVDMKHHGYRALEANVHFTPDGKWVVFRANFEGEAQVYAVEVERSSS